MKKIIVSLTCIAIIGNILSSCRKSDNPKIPQLVRVPVPVLTPDPTSGTFITATDPTAFNAKFTVDLYFKSDIKPKQLDIVVAKNHKYSAGAVKSFKPNIVTYPTEVTVTGAQLLSLFSDPIVSGDVFEFGANITLQDGTVLPIFDSVGAGYGQTGGNVDGFPNASLVVAYPVVCSFSQATFSGTYKIITDEFQDYHPGDAVTVNPGPGPNQASLIVYPSPAFGINRKPFIIDIDPVTAKVSAVQQIIGDYPPDDINMKIVTTPGANSFVDFCNGKIHLSLDFSDAHTGSFGTAILEIGK